jgi:[acyl-carrier-protein] S-malonyltransferase
MTTVNEKMAIVFPGQGSQTVGMLADMAAEYPQVNQLFTRASSVLGYDLWALAQSGPQEKLNLTETTQPLLLTSSVAIWEIWKSQGGALPKFMAGHSLGEYSALVCSEVLEFETAVHLVQQRGKFMQEAVPVGTGAMAAVLGLDDEKVVSLCAEISTASAVVEAVNFNSPGQVVVAGHAAAVEKAAAVLKQAGAKRVAPLPVSAPFHTSLMKPAGEALATIMKDLAFAAPVVPIVHNVNALTENAPEKIRALMIEQTSSPVQWTRSVQYMVENGIEAVIECGPGKVLSGLSRRIHKPLTVAAVEAPDALKAALADYS